MSDTAVDRAVTELQHMRLRQALVVTALLRHGGPMRITPADVFDAAKHDVAIEREGSGFVVKLEPAK